ncbi:MAG: HEAT repeat domain-containing protein [Nitrospirota bacterium]
MQKDIGQEDVLTPEVHDVMRALVSAIRTVKIYPPNNPVYSQSLKKSFELLDHFLATAQEYTVGVQKTNFTYRRTPVGKEAQLNRAIAQDLFAKGIREIVLSAGVTEAELLTLCRALALSSEDLAMKNGISSILWEEGATHIRVTEAGLDEIITTNMSTGLMDKAATGTTATTESPLPSAVRKEKVFFGRTLVLGDLIGDPSGFAFSMLELAKQTHAEDETVEDRLYALYQEAGRKIEVDHAGQGDAMFESLGKSVLALEPNFRDALVAGKLYKDLDSEMASEQQTDVEQNFPSAIQEVQAGRFSHAWTVQQVSALLKKATSKKSLSSTPLLSPSEVIAAPLSQGIAGIAREMSSYSPEEMERLKVLGEAGMESDIIQAAVHTFICLLPLAKNPQHAAPEQKEIEHFSSVVRQLEEMLSFFLKEKDYDRALGIIEAFHLPVEPAFKPRINEALKRTASKSVVIAVIGELKKHPKGSREYKSAYAYISRLERETTEILLELMAEEQDRAARIFYLDLLKDVGRNQIALLGELLTDGRWYFVRNIVSVLGESKTDQALTFLRKAADHKNVRIRQEVIKGLFSVGGKKAASILVKLLRDKDDGVQVTAIHAYGDFPGIGAEESTPLIEFLEERVLKKKEQEHTIEAIKALGKIGGREAMEFLKRYSITRWWKPRKLQKELKVAAEQAVEEIKRRQSDVGRTSR